MDPMGHALVVFHFWVPWNHRFSNGSSRFWCSFMDWLRCRNGFAGIPKLWRSRLTILSGFWGPEPSRKDWLMRSTFVLAIWIPANFLLDNLWPISGWRTSGYWITFWKYLKLPSSKLMWHYAILIRRFFFGQTYLCILMFDYTRVSRIQRFVIGSFLIKESDFPLPCLIAQGGPDAHRYQSYQYIYITIYIYIY